MLAEATDRIPIRSSVRPLAAGVVLAAWDSRGEGGRLAPAIGGVLIGPPFARFTLPLAWGGERRMVVCRPPGTLTGLIALELRNPEGGIAVAANGDVHSPWPPGDLLEGLGPSAVTRLIRQLVEVCRDMFRLQNAPDYAAFCRDLILAAAPNPAPIGLRAWITPELRLAQCVLPGGFGKVTSLALVNERSLRQSSTLPVSAGGTSIFQIIERSLSPPGGLMLFFGQHGMACRRVPEDGRLPPVLGWLRGGRAKTGPARAHVLNCLARRAERDDHARELLREIAAFSPRPRREVTDPRQPIGGAVELCIGDGIGGYFIKGWIRDPYNLMCAAKLVSPGCEARSIDAHWHRFHRPDVEKHYRGEGGALGFVAYVPDREWPMAEPRLVLELGSGSTIDLVPRPTNLSAGSLRDRVLGCMPVEQVTESVLATCLAPPAEALHRAHMATRRPPEVHRLGDLPSRPRWTVVVPLYRNLDYLRFQLGAFATDRDFRRAELVYVLDSPEQEGELRHYLGGLHQLYGLPIALIVMSANLGYSAACNAGAAVASGRHLLFLNSDVVPEEPGWLSAMAAAFGRSRTVAAVGPKLIFEDQSLQHAGMYFAKDAGGHWLNMHYFKGAPRDFGPAQHTRPVPAITGAAMMVERRSFESVGGFCEDYIIGDYEDSDLCLRLRERGGEIVYTADATLFHFERRSIERHRGYVRGVACLYNRWLAGQRWDQAMVATMAACLEPTAPSRRRRPKRSMA